MTPDQIGLVEQSFQMVRPMKGQVGGFFYRRLFEIAPETALLFDGVNMTSQSLKLMATLNLFVGLLRKPANLRAAAAELAERHTHYGVKREDYAPFGEALLWTLAQCLGAAFDDETRAAWQAAYAELAGAMAPAGDASEFAAAAG